MGFEVYFFANVLSILIALFNGISMFKIQYLAIYNVQLYAGAISKLLKCIVLYCMAKANGLSSCTDDQTIH